MNVYLPFIARLPSEYQEVEYIQSSGTQYIDTGIKGDISSYLSVDYKFTLVQNKSSGQQSIFGNIGSNGQGLAIYWDANSNQQGTWCGSGTGWYPGYITVGSVTTINATFNKTSGRTFSINGTTYTNSASNPSIDNGLNYFIFNDGRSSLAGYFKIYYFKIYKDGTLVRDFIPCYRVSDNVIGLFDKVNNKFYTNVGTGTFTKGSDVGTFQPMLKNAYIGEYYGAYFDFSTQDLYGHTSVTKWGNGNIINTTNQNYVSSGVTSGTLCGGQIQKEVNATKAWMRIKGKITSINSSSYSGVGIACGIWDYYQVTLQYTGSSRIFVLKDKNSTTLSTVDYSFSTNVYYYIDMKFENGILTCQLLDQNLTVLKTLTYNTGLTVLQYVGFCAYSGVNNINSFEIKEYREEYTPSS